MLHFLPRMLLSQEKSISNSGHGQTSDHFQVVAILLASHVTFNAFFASPSFPPPHSSLISSPFLFHFLSFPSPPFPSLFSCSLSHSPMPQVGVHVHHSPMPQVGMPQVGMPQVGVHMHLKRTEMGNKPTQHNKTHKAGTNQAL